jgi:hypothetical protein
MMKFLMNCFTPKRKCEEEEERLVKGCKAGGLHKGRDGTGQREKFQVQFQCVAISHFLGY